MPLRAKEVVAFVYASSNREIFSVPLKRHEVEGSAGRFCSFSRTIRVALAAAPRSAEYLRGTRGGAVARLQRMFALSAAPRSTEYPRGTRGGAATRLQRMFTSEPPRLFSPQAFAEAFQAVTSDIPTGETYLELLCHVGHAIGVDVDDAVTGGGGDDGLGFFAKGLQWEDV